MAIRLISHHRSSRRARSAAHRAMAALASNSSTRVRFRRYHAHMNQAEALSEGSKVSFLEAVQEVIE